jgi:hypothetical protein
MVVIVAQKSSPAPGTSANFTDFLDFRNRALTLDGNVEFLAQIGFSSRGVWFGKAGALQPGIPLTGLP